MFKYLLCLKGINKEMTTFEFEDLWKLYMDESISLQQLQNTYYTFNTSQKISSNISWLQRLTLTNMIAEIYYEGNSFDNFKQSIQDINLSFLEGKTFGLIQELVDNKPIFEIKDVAAPIWNSLKSPKVNLKNPDFEFLALSIHEKLVFGRIIFTNKKEYLKRMPKVRPVAKPYTLKSDMARVAVNYLHLKKGIILDPFCGIGGILLEAYDMGFECYGNDISWNDIQHLKKNFSYYFPEFNINLSISDAREQFLIDNSIDGIVTDIPYGRSSRKLGLDLYEKFLISASSMLKEKGRLVVIYANFVEFKDLALKYFNEVKEINQYINKSMTRHILVLENTKKSLNKK